MKRIILLLVLMALVFSGCEYDVPISEPQGVEIDYSMLGLWQKADAQGEIEEDSDSLLVLEYGEKEYLIAYSSDDATMYFKAYPVKIEGNWYVQFQIIGTDELAAGKKDRKYHLASYELTGKELSFSLLNAKIISGNINESSELKEAFIENLKNEALFGKPVKFVKYEPSK